MAITTTTLSTASVTTDQTILVASASGFAAGNIVLIDAEMMKVRQDYVSGTTIPVLRGKDGSVTSAHAKTANVITGLASDFSNPPAGSDSVTKPLTESFSLTSYGVAGAISFGTAQLTVAVINGTSALAMTIAAPTKDQDGQLLLVVGNGAAQHTWQYTGGLSGAGSSYDVFTVNATAPSAVLTVACNGLWISICAPAMTGTVTNLVGGIA